MNSSEIRSLAIGVVGLAAVAAWYFKQPSAPDAPAEPVHVVDAQPIEAPIAPTPTPVIEATPVAPVADIAVAPTPTPAEPTPVEPTPPEQPAAPTLIYAGKHKLGVNRVTDMARVGTATFSEREGVLRLQGRVARGKHWLELSGTVTTDGPKTFHLNGTISGIPDMAWANEAPRQRRTEGRFTFRIKNNRPYWRLYEVNGKDCVCWEGCGNDFCYIDIEQRGTP